MSCRLENITWGVNGRTIVHPTDLRLEAGQLIGLVGPNGCGKSSILRVLAGMRRADTGVVTVERVDLARLPRRDVARKIAFVDQMAFAQDDYTVRQIVELGRAPHLGRWAPLTEQDRTLVDQAMEDMGLSELEKARWARLSGDRKSVV